MRLARGILIAGGVNMVGVGVLFLVWPQFWQPGPGMSLEHAVARIEIRAVYGGIELAIGLFLLWSSFEPSTFSS